MGAKRMCILLVLDDSTCHNIVSDMLQNQTYEVLHVGKTMDTLNAIWERKNILNLVLTNIHRLNTNGVDILQIIKNKLKFPTILMSHDDTRYENYVQDSSVAAYVVNFSNTDEMNKFWQMALEKEKGGKAAVNQEENDDENAARMPQNVTAETSTENAASADTDTAIRAHDLKGKRKADSQENGNIEKKRRVIWTPKMHKNFLQAIQQLGHEKAVPKKIVEIMNEPGLTREHVASHLQKYRMSLKRAQESSGASIYDQIPSHDAKEKCFQVPPYLSSLNFSASQRYSHSIQQPYQTQFQQGTGGMNFPTSGQMGSFQQQNSLLDFANSQQADHSGLIGQHSTFLPRIAHGSNFRVYGDMRKNILFSIQSGRIGGNTNHTNSNCGLDFIGFRLSNDGKSVNFGHKGSSCAVIPNNAYSGLCYSISEDYVPKQQYSPPFLETPIENNLTKCSSVPPENLTFNHTCNNISEQQRLLLFDNAANKLLCQSTEMPGSFINQEQLSAQHLENYSAILFGDEVSVPPLENYGNYDSRQQQYSVPELPQVMLEVNSLGTEIDIKSLLETTEDRSSQLFWEENELL